MGWFNILKDIETATRSAEIWVINDEELYNKAMGIIDTHAFDGLDKNQILENLAQDITEYMANHDGFMEDLNSPINIDDTAGDGLADVDWDEVVLYFEEDIEEAIERHKGKE